MRGSWGTIREIHFLSLVENTIEAMNEWAVGAMQEPRLAIQETSLTVGTKWITKWHNGSRRFDRCKMSRQ